MFPFAWLIGLLLPACAATGAAGLPVPPVMDIARIGQPAAPNVAPSNTAPSNTAPSNTAPSNTALAGPAVPGPYAATMVPPDIVTPLYQVPAARLFAAIRAVAVAQPRTFPAAIYPSGCRRIGWRAARCSTSLTW